MIQLNFLGASGEVGASGIIVDNGVERILMDYGADVETAPPRPPLPVEGKIDSIMLSHAHLDHCGSIPMLMQKQRVPIYAPACTKDLTELLLRDSLKINMKTIGDIEGAKLPFTKRDVKVTMKSFVDVEYRKPFRTRSAKVTYFDAGHIPGSAMTMLQFKEKNVFYVGNYNTVDSSLLKGADQNLPKIDALITECTYSDRDHPDRNESERAFVDMVKSTIEKGGVALISSFAVGRAQEILLVLEKYGINFPLYMDGMAKKATTIINKHNHLLANPEALESAVEKVDYVETDRMRRRIVREPCAIITTGGMLDGGPVVRYIDMVHDDPKSSLMLTGFQAKGSAGKVLLETGRYVYEDEGMDLEMKMAVKRFDFSAHLGRKQLLEFFERHSPEKIFCVHGDQTEEFARELQEKGYDAIAPIANNRIFEI
jgi:putative mRNA 3-end processing factor